MTAPATIAGVLREAARQLAQAGVDSPQFDATVLMADVLDTDTNQIALLRNESLSAEQQQQLQGYLRRRCNREPLQYITAETEFLGQPFHCDPRAMIPRPETELLVETLAAHCQQHWPEAIIADIGTGCGVIAVSLALLLPDATIYATDISTEALQLAAENARLHGVTDRINLLDGAYLRPLQDAGVIEQMQVIVTNPPYVATGDIENLPPEVRDFEPRQALDGGAQGLDFYTTFLPQCRRLPHLRLFAAEIGIGQAPAVTNLTYRHLVASEIQVLPDLAGIPRVVLAYVENNRVAVRN